MSGKTKDQVRDAFDGLQRAVVGLANEVEGEARDKLLEFSSNLRQVAGDLAAGVLTPAQAEEAAKNITLASRSALVNAGYAEERKVFEALVAGFGTGLKIVEALLIKL